MDRSKISAGHHYLAPSVAAPSSELLFGRLGAYWQTLGVTDPAQVQALTEQVLRRAAELPDTPLLDPLARALLVCGDLLDEWLARALELPRPSRQLAAARAALLSGVAPGWPKALFAPPGEAMDGLLDTLREAIAEPTPTPVVGAMPTQRIKSFTLLGLVRVLWRKLFGG